MQYQIQGQPYPVVVLTVEPEETVLFPELQAECFG